MRLYLIRHGSTDWNKKMLLQGQTDIPLNQEGIDDAIACGRQLSNIPFDRIYSSPLKRAYRTAELIRGDRTIPLIKDDRLKEACFGILEGIDLTKIPDPQLKSTYDDFFNTPASYKPVDGGESFQELVERTSHFMDEIVRLESPNANILIVAHGAVIKALQLKPLKRDLNDFWSGGVPANCTSCILDYNNDQFTLVSQGDSVKYTQEN